MLSFNDFSNFHMLKIFSYIDSQNLLQMELVSKRWHKVIKDSILYLQNCLANLETSKREFFFDFQPIEEKSKIARRLELKTAWLMELMKVSLKMFFTPKMINTAYGDSELCFLLNVPFHRRLKNLQRSFPKLTNFNANIFALAGINEVAKKFLKTQGKNDTELLKALNLVKEVIVCDSFENLSDDIKEAIRPFLEQLLEKVTFVIDDKIKNSPLLKNYLNFECHGNDPDLLDNFAFERFKLELTRGLISYLYLTTKSNSAILSNNIDYWLEIVEALSSKVATLQSLDRPITLRRLPNIARVLEKNHMLNSNFTPAHVNYLMNKPIQTAITAGLGLAALFLLYSFAFNSVFKRPKRNETISLNNNFLNKLLLSMIIGVLISAVMSSLLFMYRVIKTKPARTCPSNFDLLTQIDSQKGQLKEISCFFKNLEKEAASSSNKAIELSNESKKER